MTADPTEQVSVNAEDLRAAVELAHLTYRSVTEVRRRMAAVLLATAIALAVLALVLTGLSLQSRQTGAAIRDRPLVEVIGVQIPDPRPDLERAVVRVRTLILGAAAVGVGLGAALTLGLWALVRPSGPPPSTLLSGRRTSLGVSTRSPHTG